jgi:hypothetical protein
MNVARISAMLMSFLVGACVTVNHGNESYQLVTGESLRSLVMGKVVTFHGGGALPEGEAVTGARCYIFNDDGSSLICGNRGVSDFGRFEVSDDRVCVVRAGPGSQCWQFFRGRTGGYKIRYLAVHPEPIDERVCRARWTGAVEACRPPSPTG